ncbi:MAG: M20 family metallopeptidase [Dehalococcoidia bacterium]
MTDYLGLARKYRAPLFELLERLVLIESPTLDKEANDRVGKVVADEFRALGADITFDPQEQYGDHFVASWPNAGNGKYGLIIGHIDTVWPMGTLERVGYELRDGRLYGPGVLDMKGGVAATIVGLRALRDDGQWPKRPIRVLINTDEEKGSPSSRPLVEAQAKGAEYAIVMEPGQGSSGALKTRRKGLGEFRVSIEGRASHAGAFPERGISAIHEMAHQILKIQSLADMPNGTTINVGVVRGGSARNTIPAHAEAIVDVRVNTAEEGQRVENAIRSLTPVLQGARITVEGSLHRPPMERTEAIARLAGQIKGMGRELGLEITEESTGGGSDANLTAAMGVPTVDGTGAVGDNPHAEGENLLAEELVNRTALFMKAVSTL